VKGNPAQPKGSIDLSEITEVNCHTNFLCTAQKQPKELDKTLCLHIVTSSRTYNLLGFQTKEENDIWISSIRFALRGLKSKRAIKKWMKDHPRTEAKKKWKKIIVIVQKLKMNRKIRWLQKEVSLKQRNNNNMRRLFVCLVAK